MPAALLFYFFVNGFESHKHTLEDKKRSLQH